MDVVALRPNLSKKFWQIKIQVKLLSFCIFVLTCVMFFGFETSKVKMSVCTLQNNKWINNHKRSE